MYPRRTGDGRFAQSESTGKRSARGDSTRPVCHSRMSIQYFRIAVALCFRYLDDTRYKGAGRWYAGPADQQPVHLCTERDAIDYCKNRNLRDRVLIVRPMNLKFSLQFDQLGKTAETDADTHIRGMIEQVLFTAPGERVNRPDFGCGLLQLVFEPNSNELTATTQYLVQGALNQWLGDLIDVQAVEVNNMDGTLEVLVAYTNLRSQVSQIAQFTR